MPTRRTVSRYSAARAASTWCWTTRHSGSSPTPKIRAMARIGIWRASVMVSASNISVKPEPARAHGTGTCRVLAQLEQRVRGTSQWMKAWNWKKFRWRH